MASTGAVGGPSRCRACCTPSTCTRPHGSQHAGGDEQGRHADPGAPPAAQPGPQLSGRDVGHGRRRRQAGTRRVAGRHLPDAVVLRALERRPARAAQLRAGKGLLAADGTFHDRALSSLRRRARPFFYDNVIVAAGGCSGPGRRASVRRTWHGGPRRRAGLRSTSAKKRRPAGRRDEGSKRQVTPGHLSFLVLLLVLVALFILGVARRRCARDGRRHGLASGRPACARVKDRRSAPAAALARLPAGVPPRGPVGASAQVPQPAGRRVGARWRRRRGRRAWRWRCRRRRAARAGGRSGGGGDGAGRAVGRRGARRRGGWRRRGSRRRRDRRRRRYCAGCGARRVPRGRVQRPEAVPVLRSRVARRHARRPSRGPKRRRGRRSGRGAGWRGRSRRRRGRPLSTGRRRFRRSRWGRRRRGCRRNGGSRGCRTVPAPSRLARRRRTRRYRRRAAGGLRSTGPRPRLG